MTHPTEPLIFGNKDSEISLLPHRGRVLGMTVGGHDALWNPEEISAPWNLGGERLWLGPESDWFWKKTDRVDFDHYQVPAGLDPDNWLVTACSPGCCEATLSLALRCHHADRHLHLSIRRRFEQIDVAPTDYALAGGVMITTTLEILGGTPGQAVDLWSIIQVPFGGRMVAPTLGNPSPRDYFDPCPEDEMQQSAGVLFLKVGGPSMFKIGLPPEQIMGRMAYVRPVGGRMLVLERSFPVHPALAYCDAPLGAPGTRGDAAQFFNDGGKFGNFGEMEHRSPAIVCGLGPQSLTETAVTTVALYDPPGFAGWESSFLSSNIPTSP
jgi:hypothetical protein